MSIIKNYQEGKTELNKLKFKSTMGSGHPGNPPLIQKRVPTESKDASPIVGTQLGRRLDDVGRMGQILARAEGLKFLGNNTLLNQTVNQSYVNTPFSLKDRLAEIGSNLAFTAQDTIRTLGSTLASIPVAGTGVHFIKGALGLRKYLDNEGVTLNNPNYPSRIERRADALPYKGADPRIKSHFYKEPFDFGVTRVQGVSPDFVGNPKEWKHSYGIEENTTNIPSNNNTKTTISLGEPGVSKVRYDKDGKFYDRKPDETAVDRVNKKGTFTDGKLEEDYVKFFFEILPIDSENSTYLQFRSYIDSFDDSYTGNWSEVKYIGRGESMYNYAGFNRSVNVSFKSAVATRVELLPMYEKLNALASTTAPSYSGNKLMRGTVVRMSIGDYIALTPGIITSVSYSWRTGYPWEIKPDEDRSVAQVLPHILDCSLSFTPIHSFTPTVLSNKYIAHRPGGSVDVGEGNFGSSTQ